MSRLSRCLSLRQACSSLLAASLLSALPVAAATLEIELSGLNTTDGRVMAALYQQAEHWMKKPLTGAIAMPLPDGRALLRFENLPDGDYAFSVMHDVNGNGKLDTNAMGIPTEPFVFSNGAMGPFGPPKFEAARFSLKGDTVLRLSLR